MTTTADRVCSGGDGEVMHNYIKAAQMVEATYLCSVYNTYNVVAGGRR